MEKRLVQTGKVSFEASHVVDFQGYIRIGRGEWIRTTDLLVPNLGRKHRLS
jgi:hypothetical protein